MWFEDDILVVRIAGSLGVPETQKLFDMSEVLYARHGYILILMDGKHSKPMSPEARKLHTERLKRFIRPSHSAIFNLNAVARMISVLMQRGTDLIAGKTFPVSFHGDEAEARAELAARRALLQGSAPAPHE